VKVVNYVIPALAGLVFPFMIPMMLMVVAVACIGMVMASTKYDV
jgi:hypothetical protein